MNRRLALVYLSSAAIAIAAPSPAPFDVPPTTPSAAPASSIFNSTTAGEIVAFRETPTLVPEMIEHHSDMVRKLLGCINSADYPGFLFRGDARFQKFEKEKFNGLARAFGPRISSGFGVTYLGELKRPPAAATTVWRVRFFDKGLDALVMVSSNKQGGVSDFVIF